MIFRGYYPGYTTLNFTLTPGKDRLTSQNLSKTVASWLLKLSYGIFAPHLRLLRWVWNWFFDALAPHLGKFISKNIFLLVKHTFLTAQSLNSGLLPQWKQGWQIPPKDVHGYTELERFESTHQHWIEGYHESVWSRER